MWAVKHRAITKEMRNRSRPHGNMACLIGGTYGRLTVVGLSGFTPYRSAIWLCVCSCGGAKFATSSALMRGGVLSCGCLRRETNSRLLTTHGGTGTRLYGIWANMKNRCLNRNDAHYPRWGGRGIGICREWLDFTTFRKWAESSGYDNSLSIERINNDGDYCQENCRWATPTEQANNRRTSRRIAHKGETRTLAQWARRTGLSETAIRLRIDRYGWDIERALTTPTRRKKKEAIDG